MTTIAILVGLWLLSGGSSSRPPTPPPAQPGPGGSNLADTAATSGIRVGEQLLNKAINAAYQTQANAAPGGSGDTTLNLDAYPGVPYQSGGKIGGND